MIQGFQQQTQPLSQYEQEILVPIVVRMSLESQMKFL